MAERVGAALLERTSALPFLHLASMSDEIGLFEHAKGDVPRFEHGYCVDDVARGLLVVVREPQHGTTLARLTETYLRFLEAAIAPDGRSHNRMRADGSWSDEPGLGDWWGHSVWALGVAAVRAPLELTRKRARRAFLRLAAQRSPHQRAMTFAALGAGELVLHGAAEPGIRALLVDAVATVPVGSGVWAWPEPRLRYGNGSLAESLILAGAALNDEVLLGRGLLALEFLVDTETRGDQLSVTGTEGRGPGKSVAQFDQQPIELAAIADATARAHDVTGDARWLPHVRRAWAWFLGANDSGIPMVDLATGAGFDGLERGGRNDNRGAESTLAALSTFQQARRLGQLGMPAESSQE
jgi:hypothetical protein